MIKLPSITLKSAQQMHHLNLFNTKIKTFRSPIQRVRNIDFLFFRLSKFYVLKPIDGLFLFAVYQCSSIDLN